MTPGTWEVRRAAIAAVVFLPTAPVSVATSSSANKLSQTYAEIRATLTQALLDADAQTPNDGYDFAPLTPLVRCDL